MPIASLLRTATFRFTALAAALFALGTLLYSVVVFYGVQARMEQQLRDHIAGETAQLLGDYGDHGLDELRHDIRERLERAPTPRLYYTLANRDGARVFDRIAMPDLAGWSRIARDGEPELILLTSHLADGYRLGVAAETRSVSEFGRALRDTTALALLAMIGIGAGSGLILSRRFLVRVGRLRAAATAVGKGDLSARIPVRDVGDDFGKLALEINRMLERIEQLVAELSLVSVNIAHDLRTPLGSVRQRLEALSAQQQDAESQALCADALHALDDALRTFAALLRIAELESGRARLQWTEVELPSLLHSLHDAYAVVAEERGQVLQLQSASPLQVRADQGLLTQLLVNLLENAIGHNGAGVNIRLACRQTELGPEVEVTDDGAGIPASQRDQVLKPFFRVDRSRGRPGNGLGLSLVARIAERHGATLHLEDARPGLRVRVRFASSPGVGT